MYHVSSKRVLGQRERTLTHILLQVGKWFLEDSANIKRIIKMMLLWLHLKWPAASNFVLIKMVGILMGGLNRVCLLFCCSLNFLFYRLAAQQLPLWFPVLPLLLSTIHAHCIYCFFFTYSALVNRSFVSSYLHIPKMECLVMVK